MAEAAPTAGGLEAQGLVQTFQRGTPDAYRALDHLDLVIEPGTFLVILGTNGSGKSTLLNAIAGAITPEQGTIRVGGRDVTAWPEHRRASLIGRVFQDPYRGTAPELTVAENLALAERRGQFPGFALALDRALRTRLLAAVERLGMGLERRLDVPIGLLSGGQRQALTLLMATISRPELLLLDEHTAALDPRSADQVLRLTRDIVSRDRLTTLMVTHSLDEAVRLGDRLILMHRGRIVQDLRGTAKRWLRPEQLFRSFDELRSADLLDQRAAEVVRAGYV
ncbi:MAG: ATP-binding cassette domain-containing protein [Gemmatimonadales bacterium]|nr:ATP-binding cassette domain-containing protein [Gemmatimonadales bacterium]